MNGSKGHKTSHYKQSLKKISIYVVFAFFVLYKKIVFRVSQTQYGVASLSFCNTSIIEVSDTITSQPVFEPKQPMQSHENQVVIGCLWAHTVLPNTN